MKTNLMKSALMFMALGAVVFTSCNKDADVSDTPTAVRFTSAISQPDAMSKAAGATWAANDAIGIYMVAATAANNADNKQHTTTSGNSIFAPVAGNEIYYPVNGENVDFVAYYPYLSTQSGMSYAVNVATQTSQPAIDLLWAKVTAKNKLSGNVALTFSHKLSKVIINTTAGEGLSTADLAAMTVTIKGMNTKAFFNLSTGTLGTSNTSANITALPAPKGSKYEAIVLPATFAANALTMEFALNNAKSEVFTWSCPANETFEAGKVYTYAMDIKRTGVGFTCTITDWTAAPNRTGDAE